MTNKLKQILASGKPAIGSWVGFSDPYAVEMVAEVGFDWLLIDMEHFPITKQSLCTILMACKGSVSTPVVRIPANSRDYIQTVLDLGAQGVMVPMINCAQDARHAVELSHYPPIGRRGLGPTRASHYYQDRGKYRQEANDDILLIVQIETPEAYENAEEILAVPGVDCAFIGNGDLANFMNHGEAGSDAVQKVVDRLIELAGKASIPVGLPTWSDEECKGYVERGAQIFTIGSDMSFLVSGARKEMLKVRSAVETAKQGLVGSSKK